MLSGLIDRGLSPELQLEAAIGKVYATVSKLPAAISISSLFLTYLCLQYFCCTGQDAEWFVADETLQLFGGSGYFRSTGIERYLRDVRVGRIVEVGKYFFTLICPLINARMAARASKLDYL